MMIKPGVGTKDAQWSKIDVGFESEDEGVLSYGSEGKRRVFKSPVQRAWWIRWLKKMKKMDWRCEKVGDRSV